ncbi:hypothetical protein HN51_040066 [Arachis hypogaea]
MLEEIFSNEKERRKINIEFASFSNSRKTMIWDIAGDEFSPIDEENGVFKVVHFSLDKPELKRINFSNDKDINHI